MASVLDRLKERKLVQWALAYLAGGWVLLEVAGFVGDTFGWPPIVRRGLILAAAAGLPVTLILAWYHGEKGRQRVSGPELLLLAGVFALGGGALALFAPEPAPGDPPSTDATGAIRSIAVLPFEDVSTIPDGAYLSDGLTASITDRLSQIEALRVVPRGVAAAHGGPGVDPVEAARALSVRAVVTGRVGEVDGRIVARAELFDAEHEGQIWGGQFDRPLTDILAVQDSLVRDIAAGLELELSPEEDRALTVHDTAIPEAFRLYLLSRFHNLSVSPEAWERGRRYADSAVRLDPGFALAWSGLSDSHVTGVYLGLLDPAEGYAAARQAVRTALALDDSLAAGHAILGFVRFQADWDWEGARASFERAVALDPANADAWQGLSEVLLALGDTAAAIEPAERALAVDPLTPIVSSWLGVAYARAGRYEEALEAARSSLELAPDNLVALFQIPDVLSALGRHEEARAALEEALLRLGGDPRASASMAVLLAAEGRQREARAIVDRLGPEDGSRTGRAEAWARLGEPDRALTLLEEAVERHERQLWFLKTDRHFESLRHHARYEAILRRMGLEP